MIEIENMKTVYAVLFLLFMFTCSVELSNFTLNFHTGVKVFLNARKFKGVQSVLNKILNRGRDRLIYFVKQYVEKRKFFINRKIV